MAGEGAHPPADACDFARYCSQLDFFSLNDHAEALTPDALGARPSRACANATQRAGDPNDPDLVAFVGFEWTQVGLTPETHYGHKNVMYPGLAEEELPQRPITALPEDDSLSLFRGIDRVGRARFIDPLGWGAYEDFLWLGKELDGIPSCPAGVDTRELPADCRENAATPQGALREARAVGPRDARDPARNHLGLLHAAGHEHGQGARPASSTIPSASA